MKNLVLTFATGSDFCLSEGFSCYVSSLSNITDADFVAFTTEMPLEVRKPFPGEVIDCSIHNLLRDRHKVFWDYLLKTENKYQNILITDCKDVIFQRNPFDYVSSFWFNYIMLASEGMTHAQSGWNLIDQYETQTNVKEFQKEYREWPVVNGGVMLGTTNLLKNLLFLLWTNMVRSYKCTDQGVLNYLYSFLKNDRTYFLKDPQKEPFCLTGEAVKEGFVQSEFKDGLFWHSVSGEPYYIVHQWDRLPEREKVVLKWVK